MNRAIVNIDGRKLAELRLSKGMMTQRELGGLLGLTETRVRHIERSESAGMYAQNFRKLAEAMQMSAGELLQKLRAGETKVARMRTELVDFVRTASDAKLEEYLKRVAKKVPKAAPGIVEAMADAIIDQNVHPETEQAVPEIPLYDMSVAAGQWVDVSELAEEFHAAKVDDGRFRIRIAGDSMTPKYKSGDVVEFLTIRFGRDLLDPGKDYYVQRSDGTATFKRLHGHKDEQLILVAINEKKYSQPLIVPWQEVSRMAKAVAIITIVD